MSDTPRPTAGDFDPEVLRLFDQYVHGDIDRRGFLSGTAIGDQFVALLGTFSLRTSGYLIIAGQAVLIALITVLASRRTLQSTLEDLE